MSLCPCFHPLMDSNGTHNLTNVCKISRNQNQQATLALIAAAGKAECQGLGMEPQEQNIINHLNAG